MKKPRGEAILKNLPDKLQAELWEVCRRKTFPVALAWLESAHGIKVSVPTASVWFSWYPRSLTLRSAAEVSSQLEDALKKRPELAKTAQDAREIAQINFELQAARDQDPSLFAMLRRGELEKERLQLEREKHEWAKKSDVEKALDALFAEIKGCPEALKHFEAMKAALAAGKAKQA
jgi:hypothetical protein